jgi:hypothetical protein
MVAISTQFITYFAVCFAVLGAVFLRKDFLEITDILRCRATGPAADRSELTVTEILRIDESRRLSLARRDRFERLVVVGGRDHVVVESRTVWGPHAVPQQPAAIILPAPEPDALFAPAQESPVGENSRELRLLVDLVS